MSIYLGNQLIAPNHSNSANQDLSNLSSTGQAVLDNKANKDLANTGMITNCILETPQDIKLELNNGILTLKAGSKVYVPNGFEQDGTTPKFDIVTIESDITYNGGSSSGTDSRLLYYINGSLNIFMNHSSGTTPPSSGSNQVFYNNNDNTIKKYTNGSVDSSGYSLPLGIIEADGTYLCGSIDQIFNGFGYIGNTLFALPNVKGLIPNGRNADGSLKDIEFTTGSVLTQTNNTSGTNAPLVLKGDSFSNYLVSNYNEGLNLNFDNSGNDVGCAIVGTWSADSNGKVTAINPKTAFHSLDYCDSPTRSGWALPSNTYDTLTLGASGTTYTAPANGWFAVSKVSGGAGKYLSFSNTTCGFTIQTHAYGSSDYLAIYIPAKKGDVVEITYSATGTTNSFRFVYAQGSESEA